MSFLKVRKYKKQYFFLVIILLILYWWCLPKQLFNSPYSMVLLDRNGELLGAKIAKDGQWRFPPIDSVPYKFEVAITEFEDRRFYSHWGVDPRGIGRAIRDNFQAKKIKSGGSTLTMQVMRMARKRTGRSFWQKFIEVILATRLEWSYSKKEILELYASHAPFGGNVVGLDAAAWRYYGKRSDLLSWGEAATLAVLPNSPGLVHPGRNRSTLKKKRDRLLNTLLQRNFIDSLTCELAQEEPLPEEPLPLPRLAPHLLEHIYKKDFNKSPTVQYRSSIQKELQIRANQIAARQTKDLSTNEIHNLAAVITHVPTGQVLAYIGNSTPLPEATKTHGHQVDIVQAPRSTGSILKPILYALMLNEGAILPSSLISDIPMYNNGYRPTNYYENYDGIVAADKALIRSLNIPFVRMLETYGLEKFYFQLQKLGLTTLHKPARHYGLSLILGGAEITLWDLLSLYVNMAQQLQEQSTNQKTTSSWEPLQYSYYTDSTKSNHPSTLNINTWSIYNTFETMKKLERPSSQGAWQYFSSARPIAWKTGTSFGFRDAWAVGITPDYAIGVWVGNADGTGRPELVGVQAAAPFLFDLFDLVQSDRWFHLSNKELQPIETCAKSGFRASRFCEQKEMMLVPNNSFQTQTCPYHKLVHLDSLGLHQVHADCEATHNMQHISWFTLPPLEEHYYKAKNPSYIPLPPFRVDCRNQQEEEPMEFIYPKNRTRIYIPIDYDGQASRTVFKVTHRKPKAKIYWHIDDSFLGSTSEFHHMELNPKPGVHKLVLVDNEGYKLEQDFEVLTKK
ncbi:MAG: penicillin-binding protein 1C [Aureispira sp.]|nr:penicillin-binding protein 1C [Aureispira sp.]